MIFDRVLYSDPSTQVTLTLHCNDATGLMSGATVVNGSGERFQLLIYDGAGKTVFTQDSRVGTFAIAIPTASRMAWSFKESRDGSNLRASIGGFMWRVLLG